MKPNGTLWAREPHTEGKHLVLEQYLNAWFPILGSTQGRIVFIDGFAGPGRYLNDERGSPLIAMETFLGHKARNRIRAEVLFAFIEKECDRAEHLRSVVDDLTPRFPRNMTVKVIDQEFDPFMKELLHDLRSAESRLAPSFVMIDPFGVKDFSMNVVKGILSNSKCEVYITIMWDHINRLGSTPEFEHYIRDIFGLEWKDVEHMSHENKRLHLYRIYKNRLKTRGAKYVLHFDLCKGERIKYSIFFATQSLVGCNRMKQAIWKVVPFGDFRFRGGEDTQPVLIDIVTPDYEKLRQALIQRFDGHDWVRVKSVREFMMSDETIFHEGQFKKPVLKPMETDGLIEVAETTRKRRFTYPDECKLRFVSVDNGALP